MIDIDFGLTVSFDGKSNTLMCLGIVKEYEIGGLICEFCRLQPTKLKNIILECVGLDGSVDTSNMIDTLLDFQNRLLQQFEPVIAIMVSLEFLNAAEDFFSAKRQGTEKDFFNRIDVEKGNTIKEFIFKDTEYDSVGCTSVLQAMLSIYLNFATIYTNAKYIFIKTIGDLEPEEDNSKVLELVSQFYSEYLDMQHIDFRIINTEKGFQSLYTIRSTISLLIFELAHCINADTNFVKCPNCKNYFVPEGRCDTLYCSYLSPQNSNKKCSEIGAKIARANKEKNDVVTREYRKIYMRYKMMSRRHPNNRGISEIFEELTTGVKEWRIKLSQGIATTEEFLDWLKQFE